MARIHQQLKIDEKLITELKFVLQVRTEIFQESPLTANMSATIENLLKDYLSKGDNAKFLRDYYELGKFGALSVIEQDYNKPSNESDNTPKRSKGGGKKVISHSPNGQKKQVDSAAQNSSKKTPNEKLEQAGLEPFDGGAPTRTN